ncbi:MAG: glutamyl-tRNA reductase [Wolinella succinogenes]|uniref:glutamyl-tRNA reductase n=1 Tax=Wolinella succinogenes TaxID=844 RepID=UPI0016B15425|nr:glutamyl-tRNA reductase [Wolinella succinogenes]NLU33710.1 glutamyl-tRNA reductase [Wolinella succinogenes]
MHYLIVSYSHKNTDIATRERLAFDNGVKSESFLRELVANKFINEGILLSTCNRVEFILSVKEAHKAGDFLMEKLSEYSKIPKEELSERADVYEDTGAIHHLFCVCSSLDSLVVGETQIAGQLKSAFKFAYDGGFCSQKLSRAMHFAFKCAASVRNCTEISKNPVSVASASVSKAKDILGDLGGDTAIVVGLGEMSQLTIKHLTALGCNVILVNRDKAKAEAFAKEFGGMVSVEGFPRLGELLNHHKMLFSATGAPHTVISKDMVEPKSFRRYWFDLAVPRDIEAFESETIRIFAVDDLQEIVSKNLSLREEQAKRAYGIIGRFTQEFYKWLQSLSVDPIIKAMREQAKEAALKEITKAISKGYLPKECEKSVEKIIHNSFNTFLHHPTIKLKEISEEPQSDTVVEAVKLLFGIQEDGLMLDRYKCEYDTISKEREE